MANAIQDFTHWRANSGIPDPGGLWGPKDQAPVDWMSGMPGTPTYQSSYDPSMALLPKFEAYQKANDQGYDAFKSMALRRGKSDWASLADTQQDMQAQDQLNKAVQSGNANTANAESQLSMQGGLSSGARERAAEAGGLATTAAEQGINRTAGQNKLQISMNDEQNRMSELGQLPGMESTRAGQWEGVNQVDQANQIGAGKEKNQFLQNLYNQQMTAWAAGKQAQATAASGGGGKGGK